MSAPPNDQRLGRLEAAEETRTLVAAYADACDAQDLSLIAAIVADDVVVSVTGGKWAGIDAVLGFFRDSWSASPYPSRHFITNVAMRKLEPDHTESTAYFLYVTCGDEESKVGWGSYRDTYARHDGRLLLQTKHITMDLLVDAREGWGAAMRQAGAGR